MNIQKVSVESVLLQMQDGSMIPGRFQSDNQPTWRTGLFVKESPALIAAIGDAPIIEIRAGMLKEQSAWPIALMMKTSSELYESWLNWQTSPREVNDLATQDQLIIHFYTTTRVRSIQIPSTPLRDMFAALLPPLNALPAPAWTMSEFDRARQRIYDRLPTPTKLWSELRRLK